MKLTKTDVNTLDHAAFLERKFEAGIYPRAGGQHRQFRKLEKAGYLVAEGWGRDMDGDIERDVLVYRLTELGRSACAPAADERKAAP
jgi:DNA-binding PadR family transcriptional regulator